MTRIINSENKAACKEAADCLGEGGVIVYPTETLYGIGCLAFDEKACSRIIEIKGRPANKGMIVLVKDSGMLLKYFNIDERHLENYGKINGALTLVLEPKVEFPAAVTGENENVAVRISTGRFVKKLFENVDEPVTSTSANISGEQGGNSIEEIYKNFVNKVELIVDSGSLPTSTGSTIIDLTKNPPLIIRQGVLTKKETEDFIYG